MAGTAQAMIRNSGAADRDVVRRLRDLIMLVSLEDWKILPKFAKSIV